MLCLEWIEAARKDRDRKPAGCKETAILFPTIQGTSRICLLEEDGVDEEVAGIVWAIEAPVVVAAAAGE